MANYVHVILAEHPLRGKLIPGFRDTLSGKSLAKDATVCVHMATNRVGVRELRQNLSRYLRRVARGECLEVTERGKPVAVLGPAAESGSALRQLVASGRATPPEGDLLDLAPRSEERRVGKECRS